MENSFHSLKFLGSEGGTSHGNFFGDDLPNPKTAEMSQITAGNSLSASKSGETSRSTHFHTLSLGRIQAKPNHRTRAKS